MPFDITSTRAGERVRRFLVAYLPLEAYFNTHSSASSFVLVWLPLKSYEVGKVGHQFEPTILRISAL